eukprot:SAG22_NODE_3042_length_1995_cov_3.715717_3_plen_407_part_01
MLQPPTTPRQRPKRVGPASGGGMGLRRHAVQYVSPRDVRQAAAQSQRQHSHTARARRSTNNQWSERPHNRMTLTAEGLVEDQPSNWSLAASSYSTFSGYSTTSRRRGGGGGGGPGRGSLSARFASDLRLQPYHGPPLMQLPSLPNLLDWTPPSRQKLARERLERPQGGAADSGPGSAPRQRPGSRSPSPPGAVGTGGLLRMPEGTTSRPAQSAAAMAAAVGEAPAAAPGASTAGLAGAGSTPGGRHSSSGRNSSSSTFGQQPPPDGLGGTAAAPPPPPPPAAGWGGGPGGQQAVSVWLKDQAELEQQDVAVLERRLNTVIQASGALERAAARTADRLAAVNAEIAAVLASTEAWSRDQSMADVTAAAVAAEIETAADSHFDRAHEEQLAALSDLRAQKTLLKARGGL